MIPFDPSDEPASSISSRAVAAPVRHIPSLTWEDGMIVVVDQRALPQEYRLLRLLSVDDVLAAIKSLAVRGAPAIGLAGALGVALAARAHHQQGGATDEARVRADAERLIQIRPTAVNLAWAVRRALARLPEGPEAVLSEAMEMLREDVRVNVTAVGRAIEVVDSLTPERPLRLLTHCNTGRLATAAVGTALGVILELGARGRVADVLVDETRPLLQGARLTAWELGEAGVPYRLCVDSAAAAAISSGLVDCVLVGADRIARNGDTANKIGTYGLAVVAARHGVPFVVVAPESSWDPDLPDGSQVVIEERSGAEVTGFGGVRTSPTGAHVFNPAFDVTPAELITAIVTEERVFRPVIDTSVDPLGSGDPGVSEASAELVRCSKELYERGWMPGTSGNLSVRSMGEPAALITASGQQKGRLTAREGVVAIDLTSGSALTAAGPRASAESSIHAAIYRATDAGAVIHVHAPYSTMAACRMGDDERLTVLEISRLELLKGLGLSDPTRTDLPVFPNWRDVARIARDVEHYLANHPDARGFLIAYHGITVWGGDLTETLNRLECLESILQVSLGSSDQTITLTRREGISS